LVFEKAYLFAFLYAFVSDVSKYPHKQTTTDRNGIHELTSLRDDLSVSWQSASWRIQSLSYPVTHFDLDGYFVLFVISDDVK